VFVGEQVCVCVYVSSVRVEDKVGMRNCEALAGVGILWMR